MIQIEIDPVLFSIGPFVVRWYGLMIALGVIVAVTVIAREAKRKGLDPDDVYSMAVYVVLAGLIGARLGHVIDRLDYYMANPGHILAFQEGGLAIWGGLIGGVVVGLVYARIRHLPVPKYVDAVAVGLILGQAIGRIGCTVNGDAWGAPTGGNWGFVYTNPNALIPPNLLNVATHPYPLYEMVCDILIFAGLWFLRKRLKVDGALFLIYVAAYSVVRFLLTFVRQEDQVLWGMQQAQVISLITFAIAVPWLMILLGRGRKPLAVEAESKALPADQ